MHEVEDLLITARVPVLEFVRDVPELLKLVLQGLLELSRDQLVRLPEASLERDLRQGSLVDVSRTIRSDVAEWFLTRDPPIHDLLWSVASCTCLYTRVWIPRIGEPLQFVEDVDHVLLS